MEVVRHSALNRSIQRGGRECPIALVRAPNSRGWQAALSAFP